VLELIERFEGSASAATADARLPRAGFAAGAGGVAAPFPPRVRPALATRERGARVIVSCSVFGMGNILAAGGGTVPTRATRSHRQIAGPKRLCSDPAGRLPGH